MHVTSREYYVLGARDSGGMCYLAGPIALCASVEWALPFSSPETARASLKTAQALRPGLQWQVLHARSDIRIEAVQDAA